METAVSKKRGPRKTHPKRRGNKRFAPRHIGRASRRTFVRPREPSGWRRGRTHHVQCHRGIPRGLPPRPEPRPGDGSRAFGTSRGHFRARFPLRDPEVQPTRTRSLWIHRRLGSAPVGVLGPFRVVLPALDSGVHAGRATGRTHAWVRHPTRIGLLEPGTGGTGRAVPRGSPHWRVRFPSGRPDARRAPGTHPRLRVRDRRRRGSPPRRVRPRGRRSVAAIPGVGRAAPRSERGPPAPLVGLGPWVRGGEDTENGSS